MLLGGKIKKTVNVEHFHVILLITDAVLGFTKHAKKMKILDVKLRLFLYEVSNVQFQILCL